MISETAKARNEEFRFAQAAEFERRKEANLLVTTRHTSRDHWVAKDEFIWWHNEVFGYVRSEEPIWWHGSFSKVNGQSHTWLLASEQHKLLAKLAWS